MTLVSIICVYNRDKILNENLLNSLQNQSQKHELILVDNRNFNFKSASSALNHGAKKACGKYLIFAHQDISFSDNRFLEKIINQIKKLDNPGIIGISGKSRGNIQTNVRYGENSNLISPVKLNNVEYAKCIDDCFFIIPKNVFDILKFDEKICFDWYLHATDYLLSLNKLNFNSYLIPCNLNHKSDYCSISENYFKTIKNLQKKHFNEKIIHDILTDWKTYIPVSVQKKFKKNNLYSKKGTDDFFSTYMLDEDCERYYCAVDDFTYSLLEKSGFFDEHFYIHNYPFDLKKYDPLTHFITVGYRKNYNPSLKFDTEFYLKHNPDVKEEDINPLVHYLKWGITENRVMRPVKDLMMPKIKHKLLNLTSNHHYYLFLKSKGNFRLFNMYIHQYDLIKKSHLFDEEFYSKNYIDKNEFNTDAILHYMFIGDKKGYKPNSFLNIGFYKKKYGLNRNPLVSYMENNDEIVFDDEVKNNYNLIKNSNLFDGKYYIENYPEAGEFKCDLIFHYLILGYKKGYNPSEDFFNDYYLNSYEDVEKSGMNPLVHYIKYGKYENRLIKPISADESNDIIKKINFNAKHETLTNFDENSPLISIIILNRNGFDYLKTLFKDFENTICYPNYEIIVVDNDSSDESVSYLKKLSEKLPLKIIENKINESFSHANNKAVNISNGEYILLLNNDVEPIYGWLNHMMTSYIKYDDVGIVGAKLIYPFRENNFTSLKTQNEGIKFTELNGFLHKNDGYIVPYNIKNNDIFNEDENDEEIGSVLGASLLIRKDLYQQVGGLDEDFFYNYEDLDLCFKVIQEGYKVIYSPKAKLYHYYQATRKDAFDLSPNDMKNRIHLYFKWNKWLCEKLFVDKLENKLIFSEREFEVSYISNDYGLLKGDALIDLFDLDDYEFADNTSGLEIKELGWNLTLVRDNDDLKIKNNSDVLICDDSQINPNNVQHNNIHLIKIAVIKNDIDMWLGNKCLVDYDIILIDGIYYNKFVGENIYQLNNNSLFLQIHDLISNCYQYDKLYFNQLIKNHDFKDTFPNAKSYLSLLNSPYFDEKWYVENYDISNDHLDAISHYLKLGFKKGYQPGPNFINEEYYEANPDVKNSGMNPLVHYELYGRNENRQIKSSDDEKRLYKKYLSLMEDKKFDSFEINENQIFFYSPWDNVAEGNLNENSQMVYDLLGENYVKKLYTYNGTPHIGDNYMLLKNLLESKVIILDQGCGLLSDVKLHNNQKVINIWHACGAFKKVGYDAPVYSDLQLDRFGKQFKQYANFIVSSPKISGIYANAHGMKERDVLGLGVPRTDLFYDETYKKEHLIRFYEKYPNLENKEIILYAPTFRDDYKLDTGIDWEKLSSSLDPNEIFIIKRHIMTKEDLLDGKTFDNIIYLEDVSIFDLMFASKLMITDYSSVIFEYSLLNKPVIHYCPDYEKYISIRDFYLDFDTELYGEIVENPFELIDKIKNKNYNLNYKKLEIFKDKFMSACDGHATERVVDLIKKYMDE